MEEEVKNGAQTPSVTLEKPLDKMTAKELREIALEIPDVTGVHAMKKEELLGIIKDHLGIKDEDGARKARAVAKATRSPHELKAQIVSLRHAKEEAQGARDRRGVRILRRRINRLKKMTRKAARA